MDTTDRNDSHLPARLPASSSHLPAAAAARPTYDLAATSSTVQISPQGVLRGLARNWWKILLIWAAVSAPLVYLLYVQIEPTYEAYSTIRAEPAQYDLFGHRESMGGTDALERYIETQKAYILSNNVLRKAIAEPTVAQLDFIKSTPTPLLDLRKKLQVKTNGNTFFIDVLFESTNPYESAAIVNSVVRTYLRSYGEYQASTNANLKRRLQDYLNDLEKKKKEQEGKLLELVSKSLLVGASNPGRRPQGLRERPEDGFGGDDPGRHSRAVSQLQDEDSRQAIRAENA